jgi:hypothetical protein
MQLDLNKIKHAILNVANIPVVIIIFDVLRGFTDGVGTLELILLMAYCLYFVVFVKDILTTNYWITIFLIYTFILALDSSNSVRTFQNYSWVFISLFMFPIAYRQVKTLADLKQINISIILLIIIYVINGLITSTLGIGKNPYGGTFVMGAFTFTVLYSGSIALVLLPLIIPDIKSNWVKVIILIFSILLFGLLFLSLRRTAIVIPVLGYFIYFFYSNYKKQISIGFIAAIVLMVVAFPLYESIFMSQMAARGNVFGETYDIEEEGRFLEGGFVVDERLGNNIAWRDALIGKEVFNEYGRYNQGYFGERQMHVDFFKIIYTLGIIGLLLYLMIFVDIWRKYKRFRVHIPNGIYYNEMRGIFVTLFLLSFFISTQGGMLNVSFRSMIFIYLGAILGVFSNFHPAYQQDENSIKPA